MMISSLRSSDYRSFFKFSSPIHFITDFILDIFSYIMGIILESKSLMNNVIMFPSPWSGGYQIFINILYPLTLKLELQLIPEKTLTFHEFLPLVPTSTMHFVPTSHKTKDIFLKSKDQVFSIMSNPKLPDVVAEVSMTHHEVACGLLLDCFCLRSSMAYQTYLFFLVVSFRYLEFF
ncbi:unnamed protein product [Arabidopsis thaliana]|uniref:(thale cress) hypothetical protein n=1 Tax=Arabidopsis thaliana TaxID=3702 RepID=A0A7G2ETD9_ARATH|nr:unnamed protein product [Arabidopsis thaliana]